MVHQQASDQANQESDRRGGQQTSGASGQQIAGESGGRTGTGSPGLEGAGEEAPTLLPPTDIYETKDAVVMLLDVPGADPDSLEVTLEKRELTISARSMISAPQGYTPVYVEHQEGNYERTFTLSDQVDSERIEAMLKDGVLRLNLPKAASAQAKKIEVKSA